MAAMGRDIYIWEDSPSAIWNDLQPQPIYYPISIMYPIVGVIFLFLSIHFLLDKLLYSKAAKFAQSASKMTIPAWLPSSEYASQLTYDKLSPLHPKAFGKKMKNKFGKKLNNKQKKELIIYQKQCNEFSKNVSKYLTATFKVLVFGCVYFYGLALLYVDGRWFWDQPSMWNKTRENIRNGLMPQHAGHNRIFNL